MQSSLTGEPRLFRQYTDSTTRWCRLYVGTLFGNLALDESLIGLEAVVHVQRSILWVVFLYIFQKICIPQFTRISQPVFAKRCEKYQFFCISQNTHYMAGIRHCYVAYRVCNTSYNISKIIAFSNVNTLAHHWKRTKYGYLTSFMVQFNSPRKKLRNSHKRPKQRAHFDFRSTPSSLIKSPRREGQILN